jgi:hypothetical protein
MKSLPGFLLTSLLSFVLLVVGVQSSLAQVDKNTLWRDAVTADLDVDFGGTGFHARWRFHRCHCGDLLVQVEQIAPDGVLTGELLLVGGQILLSRGFEGQGADITPLMQAPVLMFRLVDGLLNRAQPNGPFEVKSKQLWDEEEPSRDLNLNTGFATGTFSAPWDITGSGWITESGNRRFELLFNFANPTPDQPDGTGLITFSGDLDFRKQGFPYPESTVMENWRIQRFATGEEEAKPTAAGLTLKAIRLETKL